MKNFTNNFKQFTSRLSARWLIMALMLLVGTSSAWGWTVIYDNTDTQWNEVYLYVGKGDWSECNLKMTEYDTNLFIYNGSGWNDATEIAFGNASLSASTSGTICSKLKSTSNATYTYEKDFSKTYKYKASGVKGDNKDCGIYRNIWPNTNARVEVNINTIKLAGSFNGWANSTDMCMTNGGSCSIDINLSAGTHTFKIILDGTWYGNGGTITKSIQGWEFKTSDGDCSIQVTKAGTYTFTFDVASKKLSVEYPPSCNTLPDDAYSLSSNSAEWTGSDITLNINKKDNNYPTPSIKYNDKSTLPKEVGEYIVVATVSGDATYCDKTFNLGTFTITCPTPAESPIYSVTQQTTSCKDTDNEIGIITLTNYNDACTYQLNGEAVTVTNNQITGLAAGSYTISAAKTCGSAQSLPISGESVTITSTDLTPTIAKPIEIFGKNEICAGESTELTCNVEASKGTIDSYSWNQAGTKNGKTLTTATLNETTNYVATVTITNDGCSKDFSSEPYQVTVNPVPSKPSFVTDGEVTCAEKPVNPNLSKELASGEYLVWYDASEGGANLGSNLTSSAEDVTKIYYAAVSNGACESADRTQYKVDVEADPIEDLTLTLVDGKGNSLPSNYIYCQGDDVNVKLTYTGGIYWGEPEWNSTITAGAPITSGLRYDATNKIGAGTYTFSNLQASGTLAVALTMCGNEENNKAISNELSITVAPVPVIESVTASKISANCYEYVTLTATTSNLTVGTIVKWYEGNTLVGSGDTYRFTKETAGTANIEARVQNTANCAPVVKAAPAIKFTAESGCSAPAMKQGGIIYLVPNDDWKYANAWFAAAFINSSEKSYWTTMYDDDGDGTYACEIPSGYSKVVLCRMDPAAGNNMVMNNQVDKGHGNWTYKWNETGEITIPTTAKKYTIKGWDNSYTESNLDGDKTFRTVELNAGAIWVQDNAHFKIHAWSEKNQNEGNWIRMVDANGDKIYHADVPADFTHLVFGRFSSKAEDNYKIWEQTANLDITGGTRYVISKSGGYDYGVNAEGYWSWPDKSSTYALGVSTISAVIGADNTSIICNAQIFKTSCAPAIWYGFQYSKDGGDFVNVEVGNTYVTAGKEYTYTLSNLEKGTYRIRARVQYANKTAVHDEGFTVVIADQCEEGYDFAIGGTSVAVQACGGNRVLPAIEILSNNTPAGKTITWEYEWKNADGTAATNLDFTSGYDTPTFIGLESQSYKVRVIKKEGINIKCVQTADYQVAYDDNSPKAIINDGAETITAEINEQLVLQGAAHYTESFTWTVKENDVDVTSTMLSDASILNPTFNTKEAGTYVVTLTAAGNQDCVAHTATATVKVNAPTEDCASSEIEIGFSGSHNCFETSGGVNLLIKTDNSCIQVAKISSGNTYTLTKEDLQKNNLNYPIKIFFGALDGNHCGTNNELKGYTDFQEIKESDFGNKIIYSFPTGVEYQQTSDVCGYGRKYTNIQKSSTASTKASAPSVLSPAAVVNGQSTEVELKAYLETTGCSLISDYGFEYIKQDEKPTSGTGATKVSLGDTPISIGKTFRTQVSDLTEGVYWFRAYANNDADKSGSTSWISFTIITDGPYPTLNCNNNALQILDNGKVKVTVTNIGNQPVLKGSYGLTIIDQGAVLAYSPQQVPAIDANNGTVEFTTVLPINKNNYNVTATLTYKGRTQSCNTKICVPQIGGTKDTIRYTIDAAAVTDKCMLVFPTVYEAIDHLKSSKDGDDRFVDKVGDGYMLRQPVVMEVVYSTTPYSGNVRLTTTGGYEGGEGHLVINITNINNDGNSGNGKYKIDESGNIVDGYNPLIIRAANPNAMPALQHIALRKSRSVTLRNLNIISSDEDEDKDNAIDIDNNNNSWVGNSIGAFKNARITISNCKIKSKGFTCVHVSAVDKVYFENNEITADLVNTDVQNENTRCWGSSVKFIRSTNIKFIRNNFMGTHATSVWLQGVEKVLFMNNVFWNNNKIEEDIFAMFRIVQQSDPEQPKNIGIYYNTLFLADNSDGRSKHPKFNFLTLNSNDSSSKDDPIDHDGNFETSTIEFKYNNCYSYDLKTPGKPSNSFKGREAWSGLCYNNFWSAKSGADFSFNGCSNEFKFNVNVKDIVCTTTATDPNSLVISQPGLNEGNKPTVDAETGNVGTSGIALNSAAELYYDRTRDEARVGVAEGDWTLGAYQQTANVLTEAIIWQGSVSNEWDDRNNWIDAETKNTLTCVNTLSKNLQVIIPAPHSENYPAPDERGIVNYPILPDFDERDARFGGELVNAGQGVVEDENPITPTQFAKSIEMEYGASLRGVEHLGAGSGSHYDETTTGFTAQRDQWILVGTVVKPFDKNRTPRNVKSGDYFITGQTPHVYMHYAYMEGNTAKWSEPFTSLEESLEVTDVMAINIPNQYGAGKLTSQAYYTYVKKDPTKINDHLEAKDYSFNGRFVNETALPNYTGLTSGDPTLLNNSYPANIDPKVIEAKNLGTVLMYDYKAGSFCIDPQVDREAVIKPQHGFIFTPAGDALTITSDMVVNGETTSRSTGVEMPILSLDLYNANSINGERSRVVVKLDELKDEGPAPLDVTKIFTDNSTTPELYIVMYDNQYQRIHISNTETIIPLGIRLKKSMNVSFQKFSAEGFDKVTLVDKVLNTEYDLLNTKEVITEELSAGDIEGRFFLNLKETEEDDNIEGDDNVTTEIEEDSAEKCINILVESDNTVKVITNGVELENIYVSDMAGRTIGYKASGYSAEIELPVAQGVYMINVIGDTASRTEKVILK